MVFIVIIASVSTYQATLILPYTIFNSTEIKTASDKSKHDIKLLVSNVYQPNDNYQELLKLIEEEDPDVVFLVETNERWKQNVASLEDRFAYTLMEPLDNMYGLLFYSKFALKDAEVRHMVKDDIPSVKAKLVLESGLEVQFYGMHPEPPSPTENYRSTERDAELYLLGKEIRDSENVPIIVAGDLNDVAWSKSTRIFQKISGLLDPRKGRGFFNTFHAKYPIRWPLDHFFVSDHFQLVDIQVHRKIGSDHFPISIAISYSSVNNNEDVENTDSEEKEEAERQIEKAESESQ
ncbi:hypothetical protein E1176_13210 [Fulvivirga sp. RKSG066]|nr:hypothetical protein [Fulvivirga aurantia]